MAITDADEITKKLLVVKYAKAQPFTKRKYQVSAEDRYIIDDAIRLIDTLEAEKNRLIYDNENMRREIARLKKRD